ncbi:hypothetical protein P6144_00630 [Sphingomonas sp. HITSZ_GF]|uniref:hypothetical protein n=1 Tax=Sphingomonas sp. HITSZ_GF TaxID=3037247 RepID=UPI00240CEE7D|nr:hypothetical protein [Sphingomonas sp. HITSZ_GF]MDG2532140.1 hypothetical protein [Sphingomonas sp. HITSZ_GF]
MTSAAEAVGLVIAGGRGARPVSLQDAETEKVLNIALALLVELSASQERIDRLEREVAALRQLDLQDWKEAPAADEVQRARADDLEALQLRVLRPLIDPRGSTAD